MSKVSVLVSRILMADVVSSILILFVSELIYHETSVSYTHILFLSYCTF